MSALDEIAKRVQEWREAHPRANESRAGVSACDEFRRIDALPRRVPVVPVEELSAIYAKRPGVKLLPLQATALYEFLGGGLVGALPVGSGKTLLSFLLCHGYDRPLLILPASLIAKTIKAWHAYSRDWHLPPRMPEMISYERLSRDSCKDFLEKRRPDIVICDEAQKLKNSKTAAHRRLRRYVSNARVTFVPLSGTLIGERLMQWAPLSAWALGEGSPAPLKWATQSAWAGALDPEGRTGAGILSRWRNSDEESIQMAYGRRVRETPGVLSQGSDGCGASILIEPIALPLSDAVKEALDLVAQWELPDGSVMVDPLHASRAARQLELGCYYRWVTLPPKEWRLARRDWSATVRRVIKTRHAIDTELQARNWVDANPSFTFEYELDGDKREVDSRDALNEWRKLGPTFEPVTECIWIDDRPINELTSIAKRAPTIIWVHHREIGIRLESMGIPYYGAKGLRNGEPIESELGDRSVCASIASNATGRNLQRFSRAIIAELPDDPKLIEQLIGRMHRTGQKADEVIVMPVLSTDRAREAIERVKAKAIAIESMTGVPMKLLQGDWTNE
jgi:hypothetical protein